MPDWIPQPWNLVLSTVGLLVWWALRRAGKDVKTLDLAQKALDVLAWLVNQGRPLPQAKLEAIETLMAREKVKRATAARAVEGAAARLGK